MNIGIEELFASLRREVDRVAEAFTQECNLLKVAVKRERDGKENIAKTLEYVCAERDTLKAELAQLIGVMVKWNAIRANTRKRRRAKR